MKAIRKYIVTVNDRERGNVPVTLDDAESVMALAAGLGIAVNFITTSAALNALQPGNVLTLATGFTIFCEEVWPRRALMYSLWSTGGDKCPCFLVAYDTVEALLAAHPLPFTRDTLLTLSVGDQIARHSFQGSENYFTVRYGMLLDPDMLHPSMADAASKVLYHLREYRKHLATSANYNTSLDDTYYACVNALSIFAQVQNWVAKNPIFLPLDPKGPTTWRTWREELGYLIHDGISVEALDEAIADLASNLGVSP